jgi:CsoR family transcriptional regulator, copper-sensing transcriptional repressor
MRNNNVNKVVTNRYKIASGHLKKVIRMIENGDYCIDIIHQSLAVQAALRKADDLVLKNHLETCVSDDIKNGNSRKAIDEVMKVFEKK